MKNGRRLLARNDFRKEEAFRQFYYPEVLELVRKLTGATAAVITYPHILRTEDTGGGPCGGLITGYARFAHIDLYDACEENAPQRLARRAAQSRRDGEPWG